MSSHRDAVEFTLNGRRYTLTRGEVERRLTDVAPEVIHKHAVRVNDTWFPVVQALEVAIGVPRSEFVSQTARRHFAALGYEVSGDVERRSDPPVKRFVDVVNTGGSYGGKSADPEAGPEWHTEANVQALLVTALVGEEWRIISVANTATKEHGIDVIASRRGQTAGIEVKGFPSRNYADPLRAGEVKRTNPSSQARHWYAEAVLAAMQLRGKEPEWRSVIALPDFPRYRSLYAQTSGSLHAAQIEIWWVSARGTIETS